MTAPLITLQDARVCFGATRALDGIDLTLRRGDRMALVGANGSGKTTLLRLLHGLLDCEGRRQALPLQPEARRARCAMVFQHPFLLDVTVLWNLRLALWLQGVAPGDCSARCHAALERVGLASLAGRRARALSGGQQQRLALARAWALRPDILFLDEPTASLDPSAKREVETLITEFAADGMTLVLSTHNLGQVKRLATRAVYLEAGRLITDLPVDDFFGSSELPPQARQFLRGELPWTT